MRYLCVVLFAACTPAGDGNSASTPRPSPTSIAEAGDGNAASTPRPSPTSIAEDASADAPVDADNSAGARYHRREWVITRGNGTLVFEAPGEWVCPPLPDKRPQGFTLILKRRGGEPSDWTYYGVSETSPCHFAWSMSWMDPPPGACQTIEGAAFDRLYQELRALSPHTIRSRQLTEYVSPHRGGWGISMRWANVECEITDIRNTEVDARDRNRFDAVQDLVRKAYQAP